MARTTDDLFRYLDDLGIKTTTVGHPPLFTVEESQSLRGAVPGGHTKNLFVKDKKDRFFLIVVDEDAIVDLKTVHHTIGASSRVSFGKPDKLMDHLGVIPGAVTAFGALNDTDGSVTVVLDRVLMANDIINAHPLTNEATTSIKRDDLLKFLKATGHEPMILNVSSVSPH